MNKTTRHPARVGGRVRSAAFATVFTALATGAVHAADDDALSLEAPTPTPAAAGPAAAPAVASADRSWRLYAEGAVGRLSRRGGLNDASSRRLSLDYNQSFRPAVGWRAVLSDRLDDIHPADSGERSTVNSLRETYLSWQDEGGSTIIEFGRINLRLGPAYGFNPTDYFRAGALRAVTTADPIALRENRLGTVMLRAQWLWQGSGLMVSLAPKLANAPSDAPWSLDLGSTNRRNRGLVALSGKMGDRINWQGLAYGEEGRGPQIGANLTALLSDAAVAHAEWSRGSEPDRLPLALGQPAATHARQRLSAGLTYTTSTRTAITAEYAYNGAAPDRAAWNAASVLGANALGGYLLDVQNRQDSASRSAWLVYVTQKSLGLKNLDLTGFVRVNAEDHSRFTWLELRYHWDRFDAALQWFGAQGKSLSEYGVIPNRQSLQLLGAVYF